MNKRTGKQGAIMVAVIAAVLLAILNVCTFVIPFPKLLANVHYTAYALAEFVILAEAALVIIQFLLEESPNQKVLGLPIVIIGYATMVVQLVVTGLFYLVNAFVELPMWVVIVVEVLIIGVAIIQLAKAFFFKSRNANYHEESANTKFMDEFRARLKALEIINKNENVQKVLTDLVDTARGSDPISNDKTLDSESELLSLLQELDEAIKNGSEDEVREVIDRTKTALLERNALCKAGK